MESRYDVNEVESRIYAEWEKSGYFNPDTCVEKGATKKNAEPFSIVLPPPNVTGELHMGHAAMLVIEDIMVRYARMTGKRTLWVPGTDHAAIATQARVEKELLKAEKKSRHDVGREEFLRRVNDYAKKSHDTIVRQIKRMGASLDWSREAYTLDATREKAVRAAFKKLYDMELIYRGNRVVNWDPKAQTVISDDEVIYEERKAKLYTFRYAKDFPIAISTTRPETKVGDTAVAVHPSDERYKKFVGKEFDVNFVGVPLHVKIIADETVDKDFGTGALGVTPAHSATDWEMAERHKLPLIQVIDEYARMTVEGPFDSAQGKPALKGKKTTEAREWIVEELKKRDLIEKEEEITQNISTAERTGAIIEPLPKLQWFINVNLKFKVEKSKLKSVKSGEEVTLKELMKKAVESGGIKIMPERFEKTYFRWIENLRDWCISRQIWFGHQIPAWFCTPTQEIPRMGFYEGIVAQVLLKGKSRTYRLRDHNLKVGGLVAFENSQTKTIFGHAVVEKIDKKRIGDIKLPDPIHGGGYKTLDELLVAFRSHYPPDRIITGDTETLIYDFSFTPIASKSPSGGCGHIIVGSENPSHCPNCGGTNLIQDTDTLDTWFSSGLWPFSVFGWPFFASAEATKGKPSHVPKKGGLGPENDFANYFPNSVMETGYDILFFWVARMILMSTALTGEVPFRKVYLHGLVRDAQGRKMSKSLGNGIDPLEMAEKYGADATRLSLIIGASAGNDLKLSEDRIRGYRNFSTKIWNVARFIDMNRPTIDRKQLTIDHKNKYVEELATLKKEVTAHIENFEFHLAAEKLYHYVWHTLADKIVETEKTRLKDGTDTEKTESYALLERLLLESLKMLHPFMPFVTEEIWRIFKASDGFDKPLGRELGAERLTTSVAEGRPRTLMVEKW